MSSQVSKPVADNLETLGRLGVSEASIVEGHHIGLFGDVVRIVVYEL
jgi:hypothetical protein